MRKYSDGELKNSSDITVWGEVNSLARSFRDGGEETQDPEAEIDGADGSETEKNHGYSSEFTARSYEWVSGPIKGRK